MKKDRYQYSLLSIILLFLILILSLNIRRKKRLNDSIEKNTGIAMSIRAFDKNDFITLQTNNTNKPINKFYLFYKLNDCYPCIEKAIKFLKIIEKHPQNEANIIFVHNNSNEIKRFINNSHNNLKNINYYMCTSKEISSLNIRITPFLFIKKKDFSFSYILSKEKITNLKKMLNKLNIRYQ